MSAVNEEEDALSYGASEEEQWLGEEEAKGAEEAESRAAENVRAQVSKWICMLQHHFISSSAYCSLAL